MNKRYVRLTAIFALFIFVGVLVSQTLIRNVQAASLTSAKDTISDSRAGVAAIHTFTFTTPTATNIKTIDFQYCTAASGTCTAPTGMILTASPTLGTVTNIGGTGYTATGTSATCTGTGNTACTATLTVTTPAAQSNVAVVVPFNSGVTNPTSTNTTTFVRITTKDGGAATIDTATVAFATLTTTSLAVTASVDPTLTFSVAAVTSGSVNGRAITITSGTSATTIPFGTLVAGSPATAAHDLTVTTNAGGGYTVTVQAAADPPLSDGSKNIDYFTGTNASPATWSAPGGTSASVNTGFFGYSTEDASLSGTPDRFTSSGGNKWAGVINSAAEEVVYSAAGVSAEVTRVGWTAAVNALQPPGSYTGTVLLVATPTY